MFSQDTRFPKHDPPPPRHKTGVLPTDFSFQCGPFILYNMLKKPWQQVWQQVDLRLLSCPDTSYLL